MEATVRLKRPFSLHRYRPEERYQGITAALDRNGTHRTSNAGAASEVGAVGASSNVKLRSKAICTEIALRALAGSSRSWLGNRFARNNQALHWHPSESPRSAIAIANRTRHGAGAVRADMQGSSIITAVAWPTSSSDIIRRSRRAGAAVWCQDDGSRLARPGTVLQIREPRD